MKDFIPRDLQPGRIRGAEKRVRFYDPKLPQGDIVGLVYQCPDCLQPSTLSTSKSQEEWIRCGKCGIEYSRSAALVNVGTRLYNGPVMPELNLEEKIQEAEEKWKPSEETLEEWVLKNVVNQHPESSILESKQDELDKKMPPDKYEHLDPDGRWSIKKD